MNTAFPRTILASLFATVLAALPTAAFGQASQSPVSSQNTTVTYGQGFTPSYSGGSGNGNWQFCIANYTNFNPGTGEPAGTELSSGQWETAWTAPSAGTYSFYIAHNGNSTYANAYAGWYTLTVNQATQPTVSSSSASLSYSNGAYPAFTPSYHGGAGTGGWQFCIVGYTNWNPGNGQPSGTELPGGQWVSSWTPPAGGTYQFYVANDGNSNYQVSNSAGAYTLTVTGPVDGITWNSVGLPATGIAGQTITGYAQVTNSGTSTWTSNYFIQVSDPNGNHINFASLAGVAPGGSPPYPGASYSITLPTTPGTYTYSFIAENSNVQYFGGTQTATIHVYPPAPSITSSTSASGSVGSSFSYQITASNNPTSYSASGLPAGLTVNPSSGLISGTPTTAGSPTVTVNATNSGGTGSQTVTFSIAQGSQPSVSISPTSATVNTGQSVQFTASGGAGTGAYTWGGSASGTGATMSVSFPSAGPFSVTVYRAGDANYHASSSATANITANPPAPSITSPTSASGSVGSSFSYQITASNGPTSYTASGLPAGLTVNPSSGLISGTPTTAGSSNVTVNATNSGGTGSQTVTFSIAQGSQPSVSISPTSATVNAGQSVQFTASGGAGTGAYTWGGSASGTGATMSVSFPSAGPFSVTVYRAGDANYNASSPATANITVNLLLPQTVTAAPGGPLIVALGTTVMFSVAGGAGNGSYVWGGSASGSNAMTAVTFSTVGSATVTVYHSGDSTHQQSNTASVNVTVSSFTSDPNSQQTQLNYLVPVP